jgi:hypothetical protein
MWRLASVPQIAVIFLQTVTLLNIKKLVDLLIAGIFRQVAQPVASSSPP